MDKETYNKVIEIDNRLKALKRVQEEIGRSTEHYLSYMNKGRRFGESDSPCRDYILNSIGEILDKHDLQIRQEVEDEIARLGKEIEEL